MNGLGIFGLFLILYAALVIFIAIKKPKSIWEMAKIRFFIKYLGESGTVYFFYIWAALAAGIGIWLLIK
ncbi:hypothetical protein QUF55_02150 [Clostridiaceae bacterium HSG29]|nr:hypothetical protein [Clostridiaceae bacterium HSG29]